MKNDRIDLLVEAYRHSVEAWQAIQCAARERGRAIREEIEGDLLLFICERYGLAAGDERVTRALARLSLELHQILTGVATDGDI